MSNCHSISTRHDIAEILLKVALNIKNQIKSTRHILIEVPVQSLDIKRS